MVEGGLRGGAAWNFEGNGRRGGERNRCKGSREEERGEWRCEM